MSVDLDAVLTGIERWYARRLPAVHATLRPGVQESALDALERTVGLELPPAYRALYRWHDGQDRSFGGVFGLCFDPLERVRAEWESWRAVESDMPELNDEIPSTSHPEGAVRDRYTTAGWLSFLSDGGGNSVGVDLNPGPAGTRGQVITFGRDEEDKYVLGRGLAEFLTEYLDRLGSGRASAVSLEGLDGEMWTVQLHDRDGRVEDGYHLGHSFPGFGAVPGRLADA